MIQSITRLMQVLLSTGLTLIAINPTTAIPDINGHLLKPFRVEGSAHALFFLSMDCPISRFYAPVIQKTCADYSTQGVSCSLIYEDRPTDAAALRKHLAEFGYSSISAAIDSSGIIAKQAGAKVTPQTIVIGRSGEVRYSGRIDNFYADIGKPRRQATSFDLKDALDAVLSGRAIAHPETTAFGCFITEVK